MVGVLVVCAVGSRVISHRCRPSILVLVARIIFAFLFVCHFASPAAATAVGRALSSVEAYFFFASASHAV